MQSMTIGANQAGQRLDKFLHKYLPFAGNGFLYKMLRKKNITLNGKKAEGREMLAAGDIVCVFFSDETFEKFSGRKLVSTEDSSGKEANPEKKISLESRSSREYQAAYHRLKGINVLYEDADILILDKPTGILAQKAAEGEVSLNEWMVGYLLAEYPDFIRELSTFRPSVCNRLDRNTSGIVLCGKSLGGLQYLSECIRERSVRKFYRTICVGALREAGAVQGYLVKDERRNLVTISEMPPARSGPGASPKKAALIHTAYKPIAVSDRHTLLEVELITGKSHQIRAHLASMGHPLIGDRKYGLESVNRNLERKYGLNHQLLHACRVSFPEVQSGAGKELSGKSIEAPCPEMFLRLADELCR